MGVFYFSFFLFRYLLFIFLIFQKAEILIIFQANQERPQLYIIPRQIPIAK